MKKLLIVDDQALYLKSLELALKKRYEVLTASNFQDALVVLGGEVDLALLDIRLDENDRSNTDGIKILEWIRMNRPETPVFVMSAYSEFSYAEQALNLGAKHFFKKPIDILTLIALLEEKS